MGENVVKIIISLCIDFSIKTENIHENMLAMGAYIRDFQKAKEKVEETMKENARLEKEIAQLNKQIDSTRKLYNSYKEVKGSELVEKMEEEKKKLNEHADTMELNYSKAFGRKTDYKDMKKEVEREFTQYKNKTEETIKTCKEELTQYKKDTEETIKKCNENTEFEKNLKLKLLIENHQ